MVGSQGLLDDGIVRGWSNGSVVFQDEDGVNVTEGEGVMVGGWWRGDG